MAKVPKTTPAAAPAPAAAPTAPSAADVAVVTDAAKAADTPVDDAEAQARELASAAEGFQSAADAGAGAGAGAVVAPVLSLLDAAKADAQAQADAENANPPEVERKPAPAFPFDVRVFNNSSLTLTEKVSGALLPAGGSATITLHDEDHADAVAESLTELVEKNYIDRASIVVHPT